jgi:hypothetical protein
MRAGKVDELWESGKKSWVQRYTANVVGVAACEGCTFPPAVLQATQNQVGHVQSCAARVVNALLPLVT